MYINNIALGGICMEIKAIEKGIIPQTDVTESLSALLKECVKIDEQKTLIIESGDYYIDSSLCDKEIFYITNTCEPWCWEKDEVPHEYKIAINIKGIKNLHIIANGAKFIMNGRVTNIAIHNCENVMIEGLITDAISPDMHDLKVVAKGRNYVDYKVDYETKLLAEGNKIYFTGKDYKTNIKKNVYISWWNGKVSVDDINTIKRVKHPLLGSTKVKLIADDTIRAVYPLGNNAKVGDTFCVYDHRRKNEGIFVTRCKDVVIKGVTGHFNYGLCVVVQDCENFTLDGCKFVPREDNVRLMSSVADFVQLCMCKGDMVITNNTFIGAGDDTLNVHGMHFKVVEKKGNNIIVKFCHNQSYGYNALHVGDYVDFVDGNTLAIVGSSKIVSSKMIGEYRIALELENADNLKVGQLIEDTTQCPNMIFKDNFMTRIITRGLLITTRGKVVVENNVFDSTTMHSILLSNDAKSWYESGRCEDVTIRDNVFNTCPQYTVCVKPENGGNTNIVHSNITIENNTINSEAGGFYVKCADNVKIKNNKFTKNGYKKTYIASNITEE